MTGQLRTARWAVALLVFVLLTVALTYPLAFRAGDTIANYGDPLLNSWILAWDAHQLIRAPTQLFNANIFHPYTSTLAYSENLLGIAVPFAPIYWATDNPVLTHNLALLCSFVLAGFGTYLLAHYLTRSRLGGLVAGIAFAYAHYRLNGISQLQNMSSHWLPFTLLFLTLFFRRGQARHAYLFGLCFVLQVLSCTYYAFYTAIAVGLYVVCELWSSGRARGSGRGSRKDEATSAGPGMGDGPRRGRNGSRDWVTQPLLHMAVTLVLVAVVLAPVFYPYFSARSVVGVRSVGEQDGATLEDYVTVAERSLTGKLLPAMQSTQAKVLFPGFMLLALAGLGVAGYLRRRHRPENGSSAVKGEQRGSAVPFYALLALVGFLLSLGTALHVAAGGPAVLKSMPYSWLLQWVPGFDSMRTPFRLVLLFMLGMAILAGYGAAWVQQWSWPRRRRTLLYILPVLLALEYVAAPAPSLAVPVGQRVAPVYHWLNQTPPDSVILELPVTTSPWYWEDTAAMERLAQREYLSTYHWRPTILGYSGFVPPLFWETLDRTLNFPSTEALSYLRGMNVRYIVLHRAEYTPEAWREVDRRLPLVSAQLSPVKTLGDDLVYFLQPSTDVFPEPGRQPPLSLDLPAVAPRHGDYMAFVTVRAPADAALVYAMQPKYHLTYTWRGPNGEIATGVREGKLPLVNPEGVSYVPLRIGPAPTEDATVTLQLSTGGQTITASQFVRLDDAPDSHALLPSQADADRFFAPDLNFGNRLLLNHVRLDRSRYQRGDSVGFTMYWQRLDAAPLDDYVISYQLRRAGDGGKQVDSGDMPMPGAEAWDAAGAATDHRLQQMPLDVEPGSYEIVLGLYDFRKNEFVPVVKPDGSTTLEPFRARIVVE